MAVAFFRTSACLSPFGLGLSPLLQAQASGQAIPLSSPPQELGIRVPCPPAGWIPILPRPRQWFGRSVRFNRLDRLTQLCLIASHQALLPQGLLPNADRAGIALGTAAGSHLTNELFFRGAHDPAVGPSPALFSYTLPSSATGEVSIHLGLRGPALTFCQGAGSGLAALGEAARTVARGQAPRMLAGAADTLSSTLIRAWPGTPAAEGAAIGLISPQPLRGPDAPAGRSVAILGYGQASGPDATSRARGSALQEARLTAQDLRTSVLLSQGATGQTQPAGQRQPAGPTQSSGQQPNAQQPNGQQQPVRAETNRPTPADHGWSGFLGPLLAHTPLLVLYALLAQGTPLPLLLAVEEHGVVDALCLGGSGDAP